MTRAGGIAALIAGATYLIGFALIATFLGQTEGMAAREYVGFLADHQPLMSVWTVLIYVVNGAAFVVLALAIHERLRPPRPRSRRRRPPSGSSGPGWSSHRACSG